MAKFWPNSHFWVFLANIFQMLRWILLIFGTETTLLVFFLANVVSATNILIRKLKPLNRQGRGGHFWPKKCWSVWYGSSSLPNHISFELDILQIDELPSSANLRQLGGVPLLVGLDPYTNELCWARPNNKYVGLIGSGVAEIDKSLFCKLSGS